MSVLRILNPEDDGASRGLTDGGFAPVLRPVRLSGAVVEWGGRLYCLEFCPDDLSRTRPDDGRGEFTRARTDDGWFRIRPA